MLPGVWFKRRDNAIDVLLDEKGIDARRHIEVGPRRTSCIRLTRRN